MTNYAWTDLETTGLDIAKDSILEITVIITDETLKFKSSYSALIRTEPLVIVDPFVREMHEKSGLLKLIQDGLGEPIDRVDRIVADYLTNFLNEDNLIPIAGSGVATFDLNWMKEYMPHAGFHLNYWTMDIGCVRRFLRDFCGKNIEKPELEHRAFSDIQAHIDEARNYRKMIG